jgi:hypothetical protein
MAAVTPIKCASSVDGAHDFQPRYDEKVADPFWNVLRDSSKDKIYVGDVCRLCGHLIERPRRKG